MFYEKPFACNYWVTHRCNSKCVYCNVWRNPKLYQIPDARYQDVKKNLNDLKKLGVKFVDFTGGEPLLNKELPKILKYAKNLGFFVQLTNNGSIYPEIAEEIRDSVSQLSFSLDTLNPEEYKEIRGIDNFKKVIESIDIAKNLKQNICIICTVSDDNFKNIPQVIDFCKNKKTTVFIHPVFRYFDKTELKKGFIRELKKYFWHPYVRIDLSDLKYYEKGGNNIKKPSCKAGKSVIAITPDNFLFVPCFHKVLRKVRINGNLFDLYHSDNWKNLYKDAGKYDFCQGCNIPCYLGASPLDKIDRYFFQEIMSYYKILLEKYRKK
jgi:MoaA/NifB/PqqE/SkfB family radical SAM enzyme